MSDSERVDRILDVLLRLAAGDLDARCEVSGAGDNFDALAGGINMLAEEIDARVTAVEHAAKELRRLVGERSRQLADALAAIADADSQPVEPGALVEDRYRVVKQLGSGGMGTVHEVVRVTDGSRLAMKTLHGRVDRSMKARFAREAQIATEVRHPNLVPVVDLGVTQSGMMFVVMELIDGSTLEDERPKFGQAAWALPLLAQIANGLCAIHARSIVHRDLKPANVLLARGVARIADFGLACLRADVIVEPDGRTMEAHVATPPPLTRAGVVFGTPEYLAPELVTGAHVAQPASDVFSFGVLACELLTGRRPFAEPPLAAVLHNRPIARTASIDTEGVPLPIRDMLDRCLALDPRVRPRSDELHATLAAS